MGALGEEQEARAALGAKMEAWARQGEQWREEVDTAVAGLARQVGRSAPGSVLFYLAEISPICLLKSLYVASTKEGSSTCFGHSKKGTDRAPTFLLYSFHDAVPLENRAWPAHAGLDAAGGASRRPPCPRGPGPFGVRHDGLPHVLDGVVRGVHRLQRL